MTGAACGLDFGAIYQTAQATGVPLEAAAQLMAWVEPVILNKLNESQSDG